MKEKNVEAHLKVHLLRGKSISHNQAQRLFGTNRLAEYIRRLRAKGMKITMKMEDDGDSRYGVYRLEKTEVVSKIQTRQYI
jgi:hypothetical protein